MVNTEKEETAINMTACTNNIVERIEETLHTVLEKQCKIITEGVHDSIEQDHQECKGDMAKLWREITKIQNYLWYSEERIVMMIDDTMPKGK